MRWKRYALLLMFCVVFLVPMSCSRRKLEPSPFNFELLRLADYMTGSFASTVQAETDSSFFDIRLEMVRFNHQDNRAIWLYIEQAAEWSLDKPYRQRIYRLSQIADSLFISEVFTLPGNPLSWTGAWSDPQILSTIFTDSLHQRDGCTSRLRLIENERYEGGTIGNGCSSGLSGADYTTSEVFISPDTLWSWDRGWDENGLLVWGSEVGPYIFIKQKNYSL